MTLTASDLRVRYEHVRQLAPVSSRTRDAYVAWFRQSCVEGNPPDALRAAAGSESERFFERVAQGTDGHCYWVHESRNAPRFHRDDGTSTYPNKWWYEHVHGKQGRGVFRSSCGQSRCITPGHTMFVPWGEVRMRFTDETCLGALQVVAQRLGHSPSVKEYKKLRRAPSSRILQVRFGSWPRALAAAGLPLNPAAEVQVRWTDERTVATLRAFYLEHGFVPSQRQWEIAGHSPSLRTIQRYLGWAEAWRRATA